MTTEFKLKPKFKPLVITDEPWYDLTSGGYINPSDFLVPEDALKVNRAIDVIQDFLDFLEKEGILEYS